MKIEYSKMDKLLIIKITEEIDHHSAEKIRRRVDYEIEKCIPKEAIFDFSNVNFMDSSGIGMLIGRYKLASMFGTKLSIANIKPSLKKILEMSGILKIIPIIEDIGGNKFEKCI